MKFIKELFWKIRLYFQYTLPDKKFKKEMLKKYPDYDETDGKMWGDLIQLYSDNGQGIQGCSDFEIIYDRARKEYSVGIETAFFGKGEDIRSWELPTLEYYLTLFTKFMDENGHDKNELPCLFMQQPKILSVSESIPKLYCNFKMFVYGFRTVCKEIEQERIDNKEVK